MVTILSIYVALAPSTGRAHGGHQNTVAKWMSEWMTDKQLLVLCMTLG